MCLYVGYYLYLVHVIVSVVAVFLLFVLFLFCVFCASFMFVCAVCCRCVVQLFVVDRVLYAFYHVVDCLLCPLFDSLSSFLVARLYLCGAVVAVPVFCLCYVCCLMVFFLLMCVCDCFFRNCC